jgi:putative tryptophan/tyrosine transport system substrate-binding protein
MRRREFIAGLGSVAVAWRRSARAQQSALPVIGFLNGGSADAAAAFATAFRQGLGEQGYAEGRNVQILYRWAENRNERLPLMATDLVRRRVDVIVTTASPAAALAAKAATTMIPIVFQTGADPVELGLVASLNRPGGNVTGVSMLAESLTAKRVGLLRELVPAAMTIAYLVNPITPDDGHIREAEMAARVLGVHLLVLSATSQGEIEAAFATLVQQRIGALLVDSDALFFAQRDQLVALSAHHALPAIYHAHEITKAGGLMSYGPNFSAAFRLTGNYAGRILKGEKPADLPVQQSTRIELVINMRTAKTLGLTIPETLLATADEVIE